MSVSFFLVILAAILILHVELCNLPIKFENNKASRQCATYAVISGATGGVGTTLLNGIRETPIILHRKGSTLPKGDLLHLEIDYNRMDLFVDLFDSFLQSHGIKKDQIVSLYNIHGCGCFEQFDHAEPEVIREFLNANLHSHVFLTHHFLENCESLARIGAISSLCAIFPGQMFQLYSGAKAFLESFYTSLAEEYPNISIVVARPPAIRSTRFMHQVEMRSIGSVGNFVNLPIFSVRSSSVANILTKRDSGVYNTGWLVYSIQLSRCLLGVNVVARIVAFVRLGRFAQ